MTSALPHSRVRACARVVTVGLAGALLTAVAPAASAGSPDLAAASAYAQDDGLPPGRRIRHHTVRPGDTATGLAVRYHAWTAELIRINGLDSAGTMYVGQRLRIPVVVAAARRAAHGKRAEKRPAQQTGQQTGQRTARHAARPQPRARHHADPNRWTVRRTIETTARRHGVDPQLALAVSWQEAGWQMHHVSSANAIGAMQVLPDTGTWMSLYAGRPLRLHRLRDNVLAGVLLLNVLDGMTRSREQQVAAYYQGIGAVRKHGLYDESRHYVANVLAIKDRLERGRPPS